MEDKDADSYGNYFTTADAIIGTLFSGCAYSIADHNMISHTSKFIVKAELPQKGKMKFTNESESDAIKLALKACNPIDFYVWAHAGHLYWNTHNVNEEYPFNLCSFNNYFKIKVEYKGWKTGNQYGI
jgi:hypothetical protein